MLKCPMGKIFISDEEYVLRWPLHALLRDYSLGEVQDDDAWLEKVSCLVNESSASQACGYQLRPLDMLSPAGNAPWSKAPDAAALLVRNGANPLVASVPARSPPLVAILGSAVQCNVYHALSVAVVNQLISNDALSPLQTQEGGNLLHLLCRSEPSVLPWMMEEGAGLSSDTKSLTLPNRWLTALDCRGRSPLDTIWEEGGTWDYIVQPGRCQNFDEEVSYLLAITGMFVERGVDICRLGPRGVAVADLMVPRITSCQEALDQLERSPLLSMLEQHALDRQTPPPRNAQGRPFRI